MGTSNYNIHTIMSNNEQSSIELFAKELAEQGLLATRDYENLLAYQKAKAMLKKEQEQLIARWAKLREQTRETSMHIGFAKGFRSGLECHEDYYQELDKTDLTEDEFTRNYIVDRFEESEGDNDEQQ